MRFRCSAVSRTRVSTPPLPAGASAASSALAILPSSAQRAWSCSAMAFSRSGSFSSAMRSAKLAASACFFCSSPRSDMGAFYGDTGRTALPWARKRRCDLGKRDGRAWAAAFPRRPLAHGNSFQSDAISDRWELAELLLAIYPGRSGMALRLRYQIDSPRQLREHVHLVDGAGYFFFPGAVAPKGALASLEIDFSTTVQVATLRGWVWARSSGGGLWLELARAQRGVEQGGPRHSRGRPPHDAERTQRVGRREDSDAPGELPVHRKMAGGNRPLGLSRSRVRTAVPRRCAPVRRSSSPGRAPASAATAAAPARSRWRCPKPGTTSPRIDRPAR